MSCSWISYSCCCTARNLLTMFLSQVTLDAFGERYDLNLEKNDDLMADQFDIFYADPTEDGRTSFQRAVEVRFPTAYRHA